MTTDLMNQLGWIAFDVAYTNAGGGHPGDRAGMLARNAVHARAYLGEVFEGPAEESGSFSRRSTMRLFEGLQARMGVAS